MESHKFGRPKRENNSIDDTSMPMPPSRIQRIKSGGQLTYGEFSLKKEKLNSTYMLSNPIYMKNNLASGKHMPSKGMYNIQKNLKS